MDFTSLYKIKDAQTRWIDITFYVAAMAFILAIACYCIFAIKIYLLNSEISAVNAKIAVYGSEQQKATEKEIFSYRKKIDDFSDILAEHAISSNVFGFIESHTLPNVWFSNFEVSSGLNELRLSGEAENMETLSQQFKLFEDNKEVVRNISVVNSQIGASGKMVFTFSLFLNSKLFEYNAVPVIQTPAAPPQ